MHIDLNKITKEEFVDALICSSDTDEFYLPREEELLSMQFDFEQMKEEFLEWMFNTDETK